MQIEYVQTGGFAAFPGLSKPFCMDSDTMPPTKREQLEALLEACDFFHMPARPKTSATRGAADMQSYTITVIEGKRRHTVRFRDPIRSEALAALVAFLQEARTAERRAQPD